MVAMMAAPAAALIDVAIESRMTGLSERLVYQLVPKPSHANSARPLLKEKTTIIKIGRNRNT